MICQRIGIIAGEGKLPELLYQHCKKHRIPVFVVFLGKTANFIFDDHDVTFLSIFSVTRIIGFFHKNKVTEVILAGGLQKPSLKKITFDPKAFILITKILKNKFLGDNKILTEVIKFLELHNFKVTAANHLIQDLHLNPGFNNKIKFHNDLTKDIDLGIKLLQEISDYDIGQSVVIQNGRIIAVEAVEGTDKMIERASKYVESDKKNPAILIKLKKLHQDARVDLPTIGIETIKKLSLSGIKGVVIEAKNTIVIEKDEVCFLAEKAGIFIYGI